MLYNPRIYRLVHTPLESLARKYKTLIISLKPGPTVTSCGAVGPGDG